MSKNNNSCFDFLKEGHDKQFDKAMGSIGSMYENLFNGDKLDQMFQCLKVQNNPIIQPIDQMSHAIFNSDQPQKGPKYIKTQTKKNNLQDDEFVVGEPLYQNNQIHYPPIQNPYTQNTYAKNNMNNNYVNANTNPYVNPYYQNDGGNRNKTNYFGTWSQTNSPTTPGTNKH